MLGERERERERERVKKGWEKTLVTQIDRIFSKHTDLLL
jgi:hypothetical protein